MSYNCNYIKIKMQNIRVVDNFSLNLMIFCMNFLNIPGNACEICLFCAICWCFLPFWGELDLMGGALFEALAFLRVRFLPRRARPA